MVREWDRQLDLLPAPPPTVGDKHPALDVLRGNARRVFEAIALAGDLGMTADEVGRVTGLPHQAAAPRILDLEARGLVEHRGKHRRTRRGRPARVWVAVPPGATPPRVTRRKRGAP